MKFLGVSLTMIAYLAISSAEEVTEYCEEQCNDVCHVCQEPVPCTEEEIDCGLRKPDPAFGGICPPQPICVQKEFNCPCLDEGGNEYPLTTKVECDEDEVKCTGPSPGNDCPGQDVCVPRGVDKNGNLCDGFCPIQCNESELHCSEPIDPETGCAQRPICIQKAVDIYGKFCPHQQCPIVCLEIEFYCESPIIKLGCKGEDLCVTRGRDLDGELCPETCPTECDPVTEIKCNSQTEYNGCTTQETCHAKARDINGEFCLDNSDSHGCPIICRENEILCPAKMNILGCKGEANCYLVTKDDNGHDCPESSICPTICQPNEVSCPGGIDENGCKKPDICIKQERDYDGDLCPAHCPQICDERQILCEGHIDDNGCMTPDACTPKGIKTKGNDVGDLCPGYCPANCKHGEILCSSQEDCNGCMTGEMCRPKATDNNGMFCADDSASHDCPIECDEDIGEVLCPNHETVLGCKPRAMCHARPKDSEGEFCPAHSVCEKECQSDEMLCSDGIDSRGCKNADLCIPRGRDHDGNLCPEICPPKCTEGEYFCAGLYEGNGCRGSSLCVERKQDKNGLTCPEVCPVSCSETELKIYGETDARGCLVEYCQGNVLLAIGGYNRVGLASTELINVDIHTSCSVSPYPFAISRHASVVTPTGIVTCGGRHKSKHLNTCKRLTSSGNWASFPSMISKRSRYGLLMMNGLLWAVGGYGGKEMPWSTMEYIDPRNPTEWTLKSMPFDVGGHCLTELSNQRLMVTGGYRSGTYLRGTWILDTQTGNWTQGPYMRNNRARHGCFSIKEQGSISKVYVFGGLNRVRTYAGSVDTVKSTEVLNVSNLTWSNGPNLPGVVVDNAGVPSVDNKYLGFSVGGYRRAYYTQYRYPGVYGLLNSNGNQRWIEVGSMNEGRGELSSGAANVPSSFLNSC